MAKRRKRKSSKCPEPFNTLIDIAGGVAMNAIANKMEDKHHYRKRGVPNPYRASALGLSMGKLNSTEDIIKLGGFMGAMGAFDPDDTESTASTRKINASWDYDDNVAQSNSKNVNKYAWRMNCEDGSAYGVYPENYETRSEYNAALSAEKDSSSNVLDNTLSATDAKPIIVKRDVAKSLDLFTFCKVSRLDNGSNQYYLVANHELEIGDIVIVPTESGSCADGIVLSIENHTKTTVPIPLTQAKNIIEKK